MLRRSAVATATITHVAPHDLRLLRLKRAPRRLAQRFLKQSNSNYACNAIVWDRLFGTYNREPVEQTGIGPTQPTIWQMMQLPWREPEDADTVAERK